MNSEAPVNTGHAFANAAEDHEEREDWLKAAEAHSKAAEQFEIALKDATDAEATRTLRLLSSNHTRKANELNRKAQRLIKNTDQNQKTTQSKQLKKTGSSLISRLSGNEEAVGRRISEIGESYALLSNEDQEDDPFNKFLGAVDGLVDQLFNPAIAFTSAPLDENDNPISSIISKEDTTKSMVDSYYLVPNPNSLKQQEIPFTDEAEATQEESENEKLKKQVAQLTKRLKMLEMFAEENNTLKSSVLQFRNDVHKQAKRIMQSYHESAMRSSAAALLGGGSSSSRYSAMQSTNTAPSSPELVSRLKKLEEENKQLRIQNEKQKVLMNRYKERWEMLKENAKKRRAVPTSSTSMAEENTHDLPSIL
ncbi:uncharacterized protein B0P05DRAFT_556735 [Gilbertella persicaria]|uniref:uncharacterized protein n=1 Tax=Gilbertella persicaria TaxID=101096 RepID=UPI00221F88F1|nr:uncharacterized protein B0P05DRAFT_556735 [Gilbertella persicaria]KAI8061815.1 hypothetical protein B0P05DRAFT_556735 [Gilbertella persicaria]